MITADMTPEAVTVELGRRLKQARLNVDKTQVEVAELAGVSRMTVINAEKGKAQLEVFVAIMIALQLEGQLELFLPLPEISPIQLARLQGRRRQRASGQKASSTGNRQAGNEPSTW